MNAKYRIQVITRKDKLPIYRPQVRSDATDNEWEDILNQTIGGVVSTSQLAEEAISQRRYYDNPTGIMYIDESDIELPNPGINAWEDTPDEETA